MQSLTFTFLLLVNLRGMAQTILPVYYYIPPTSGCNGVAAIDLSEWNTCNGPGGAYLTAPLGCADFTAFWSAADTLYVPICDDPCEFYITDELGNVCICGLGFVTEIQEIGSLVLRMYRSEASLLITSTDLLHSPICRIYEVTGRLISEFKLQDGTVWNVPVDPTRRNLIVQVISDGEQMVYRI